jgi:hypothetical protein
MRAGNLAGLSGGTFASPMRKNGRAIRAPAEKSPTFDDKSPPLPVPLPRSERGRGCPKDGRGGEWGRLRVAHPTHFSVLLSKSPGIDFDSIHPFVMLSAPFLGDLVLWQS